MGTRSPVRMSNRYVHGTLAVKGRPDLKADFDATKWFETAADDKIEALFKIGCAGDYEAEYVVRYLAKHGSDQELRQLYEQCSLKPTSGSKLEPLVTINRRDASSWLRQHRPALADKLDKEGLLV